LETRLQSIIEGSVGRVFPAFDLRQDLVHRLTSALQSEIREQPDGSLVAPNQFTIFLPGAQAEAFQGHQELLDELAQALDQAAQVDNLLFLKPPTIRLLPAPEAAAQEAQVLAQFDVDHAEQTSTLIRQTGTAPLSEPTMPAAYFIADGTLFFPIQDTITNLGRQEDNHLVLNDPRVSRQHAQLRYALGRFMLFDLGSTSGTYVNGIKITQQMLSPGDVVSLGGIPLVFGIESTTTTVETQEFNLDPKDR
jgi:predicted component of type VI protein secretion system